jgi:8-oxo-dGTP diphosphatase
MDKKFDLTEHTEYKWANVETIPTLDFDDSDLQIYPEVLDYINKNK